MSDTAVTLKLVIYSVTKTLATAYLGVIIGDSDLANLLYRIQMITVHPVLEI